METQAKVELFRQLDKNITCIQMNEQGELHVVTSTGEVFKIDDDNLELIIRYGGQTQGIQIDDIGKNIFLGDVANQSIMIKSFDQEEQTQLQELISEFEGSSLLGPNQLVLSSQSNCLFFTDSGPFGETTIENPKGSVFMIDLDEQIINPLALNCLAHPSGIAITKDEKKIYVCETNNNALLRFNHLSQDSYNYSVFVQFQGRFGPNSVAISESGLIYVSRYEFKHLSNEGIISVINPSGQIVENIHIPNLPEISCISFSSQYPQQLFIAEQKSVYYTILESDDKK